MVLRRNRLHEACRVFSTQHLHVEGLEPWIEKSWTGRTLAIGPVRATVAKQIVRCAATNVNPATAERDMRLPQLLDEAFGANLCGIYLDVIAGGRIAPGHHRGQRHIRVLPQCQLNAFADIAVANDANGNLRTHLKMSRK